jgi:GAF domain-containing protein
MTDGDLKNQLSGLFSSLDNGSQPEKPEAPARKRPNRHPAGKELADKTPHRLEEQLALPEIEHLYQASAQLNMAQSYDQILQVLQQHTLIGRHAQHINLNYFDRPWTDDQTPEWVIVLARWSRITEGEFQSRYHFSRFPSLAHIVKSDLPTIIADVDADERLDEEIRHIYQSFKMKSVLLAPLVVGGSRLGFLSVAYFKPVTFDDSEVRLMATIVGQASVAVQNFYNVEQARARAEREQRVRTITDKIRNGADTQTILRTTLEELNHMLGASTGIIRVGTQAQLLVKQAWSKNKSE